MDRVLRERARAWSLAGDLAERVELLAAARRRGDQEAERALRLAAYLGQAEAREALGLPTHVRCARLEGCVIDLDAGRGDVRGQHDLACPLPSLFKLERWLSDLEGYGAEVLVRAALATARRALEWWDRLQGWQTVEAGGVLTLEHHHYLEWSDESRHRRPRLLLEAVERYLLEPTPERRRLIEELPPAELDERPFKHLGGLVACLEGGELSPAHLTVIATAQFLPEEKLVRGAVVEALVPWALGLVDPLRGLARLPEPRRAG